VSPEEMQVLDKQLEIFLSTFQNGRQKIKEFSIVSLSALYKALFASVIK